MVEVSGQVKVSCYHCGDDCAESKIQFDDKAFCCYGCRAVYELIESSDLKQYYLNKDLKASRVADRKAIERKFNFLDLPEVREDLVRYEDDKKSMVRLYLAGIHCSSCIYLLEHLPKLDNRVFKAEVNFIRKEISITYDHHSISLKQLVILLSELGYPPTINLDSLKGKDQVSKTNPVGLRIAVAGFCFGNSMLISLPEYLDVGYQLSDDFKLLFGWTNVLLALPVVLYAAQDYFISSWKGLKHGYLNIDLPISLGILTLFSRSLIEIISTTGSGYVDSLTGLVFFLLLGKWYQGKTYQALSFDRDYTSYFPISVTRLTGGNEESVMLKDLKEGDAILIHNQELIPADGMITMGQGTLDYSFVTGESDLVEKREGDLVFAGGRQAGGTLEIKLHKAVDNSELTKLWNHQTFVKKHNQRYEGMIDKVGKYFTLVILFISISTGLYWAFFDPEKVWTSVTAVLIIACPCALALTLPFAFGHSIRILGSRGIYLKNAGVIEPLAKVRELVFDKTGTLTKNDPMRLDFMGGKLTDEDKAKIKSLVAASAHPLSKVVSQYLGEEVKKGPVTDFEEIIGQGVTGEVASSVLKIGSAQFVGVKEENTPRESQVHVLIDGKYRGCFSIRAKYREGVFEDLRQLKKVFKMHLLSGDNATERKNLEPYFDQMMFDQQPADKLDYVSQLDSQSLMIGDGLNDAGALKAASVGFAVCEDIHQFSPSCDAMVSADSLKYLPGVLKFARSVIYVVLTAFLLSFTYNIVGLSFAVTGNLTPVISAILMPVSSVTVVGFITLAVNGLGYKYLS